MTHTHNLVLSTTITTLKNKGLDTTNNGSANKETLSTDHVKDRRTKLNVRHQDPINLSYHEHLRKSAESRFMKGQEHIKVMSIRDFIENKNLFYVYLS
jgi:hypothetical protein